MVLPLAIEHMAFLHSDMRARCQEPPLVLPQEELCKERE